MTDNKPRQERYPHYARHGIAEPWRHDTINGGVRWSARCRCGWYSQWRFHDREKAEEEAAEHMRIVADDP